MITCKLMYITHKFGLIAFDLVIIDCGEHIKNNSMYKMVGPYHRIDIGILYYLLI